MIECATLLATLSFKHNESFIVCLSCRNPTWSIKTFKQISKFIFLFYSWEYKSFLDTFVLSPFWEDTLFFPHCILWCPICLWVPTIILSILFFLFWLEDNLWTSLEELHHTSHTSAIWHLLYKKHQCLYHATFLLEVSWGRHFYLH